LTFAVLTRNEATRLGAALASIPAGAAVLVIDAESEDGTAALARARGAEVVVRPWRGFADARRFALSRARTAWTFMLDADEALDPALRAALLAASPPPGVTGFAVRRTTYFCGRPIAGCGWGDERILRLVRTARARIVARPAAGGNSELHERLEVDGVVDTLGGRLLHDSYPSLEAYQEKFARYTALEAAGLAPSGAALAAALATALARAPWLFFVRGGWRDGWRGAYIAGASALYPAAARWKAFARGGRAP
jgi:glycosyltransferase involved in cell wall biosynthesis